MKRPSVLLVNLLTAFLFAELPPGAIAKDFHVAAGSSGGDGSEFKPFATLAAAVTESRFSPGPHRILIQGGSYYDVAVQLGAQDSGLVIENAPGQSATLYGGVPLGGWQAEGKLQVAQLLPPPPGRCWDIRLLLVNDESRPRARYPAAGTLTHETAFNVPWMSSTGGSKAVIRNNHIWKIGRSYPSAIGIYQGGRECLVSHNEMHDCSYSAINYGGNANIIESNLLYDCMKVLHDGAAIYLFAATNCILRGNLARDFADTGGIRLSLRKAIHP